METWFCASSQESCLRFLLHKTPDGMKWKHKDVLMPTRGRDGKLYGCVYNDDEPYLPEGVEQITEGEGLLVCGKLSRTFAKIYQMKLGLT